MEPAFEKSWQRSFDTCDTPSSSFVHIEIVSLSWTYNFSGHGYYHVPSVLNRARLLGYHREESSLLDSKKTVGSIIPAKTYELSDGSTITVARKRFRSAEGLLQPRLRPVHKNACIFRRSVLHAGGPLPGPPTRSAERGWQRLGCASKWQ